MDEDLSRMPPIAGRLVTETFEYDGRRQITVYVPPDPAEAVVFAADGGGHGFDNVRFAAHERSLSRMLAHGCGES